MKILLVNSFLYHRGGDTEYMFKLGNLLQTHGHQVYFWGMDHKNNIIYDHKNNFAENIDFVKLNSNKTIKNSLKVLHKSVYNYDNKRRIAKYISKVKPDLVHLNNIHSHLTPSIINAINCFNIPIIWTLHDFKLLCPNTHFLSNYKLCESCLGKRYYNCTLKRCKKNSYSSSAIASIEAYVHSFLRFTEKVAAFIVPSNFAINKLVEFGFRKDRIKVMRHFLKKIPFYDSSKIDSNYILFFGRLEKYKGVFTLLKAVEHNGIPLKIVGDGSLLQDLSFINKLENLKNIEFLGFLRGSDLKSVILNARFVVSPSEVYETFGYTVAESMMASKPVVGSKIGAIPELVKDGVNGLLFETGNSNDLADKINWLNNRPKNISYLSRNAYSFAEREFDSEIYYRKLISLYLSVIN